jgi:uncharacterized membrane protein
MNKLRDLPIDGVLLALPLGAVAYLVHKMVGLLVPLLTPAAHLLPPGHWFGVATIDLAALLLLALGLIALGVFSRSKPGLRVAETLEQLVLSKIPGYLIIKSIAADFSSTERDEGLRPALVSFDDNQVLGFVVEQDLATHRVVIFLPGAPTAGAGNVVVVPTSRVQILDVPLGSARRAMKQRGLGLLEISSARAVLTGKPSGTDRLSPSNGRSRTGCRPSGLL